MFGKLIKHELRASGRTMLPILIAMPTLGILSNLAVRLLDKGSGAVVSFFCDLVLFVFGLACMCVCFSAFALMIVRWYRSVHSTEGYLTNTLPVSVHGIIWSRLLVAAVYFILSIAVLVVSVLLMNMSRELIKSAGELIAMVMELNAADLKAEMVHITVIAAATCVVYAISKCLQFYAAMSVGHGFDSHRWLMSILAYVVMEIIYVVAASFAVRLMCNIPGISPATDAGVLKFALCGCAGMLLYGTVCYFITVYAVKNRLNLE